jgi:TPR repeat protein
MAAEQGDADAQSRLGLLYANGRGAQQDLVQAHLWLSLAAAQGDKSAAKERNLLVKKMTPAQLAQAQKLARGWKPKQ